MSAQDKAKQVVCPVTPASVEAEVRQAFEEALAFARSSEFSFWKFEKQLFVLMAALGRLLLRLFLTARHQRLDVQFYVQDGGYRVGKAYAERTVKTAYGEVKFGRTHLIQRKGGSGFYPLDAVLGLTRDRLSPWVMQLVGRLATRMSYAASRSVCKAVLRWAPATETIEQVVLGLGRQAQPFMEQLAAPARDGEVLIIESDGKCPPTATEAELAKRRGKRRHKQGCSCGCQRHRGKIKRQARGPKKRRKKGDKSKNGKEVMMVVMYTLRRGADGKLHGPVNKKVWGTFTGRKAAAQWARAEATKRGFGPDTTKTVQIIVDGAHGLEHQLRLLFPKAIFTLDVRHPEERLWSLGHHFHKEGSPELRVWVEELKKLLYGGRAEALVQRLQEYLEHASRHGPGTKARRKALQTQIGYFSKRMTMMRYDDWLAKDLVIASGQVEGAVRHVVGERMDCAGMRWVPAKAEALLHLRCIELNGDWQHFFAWAHQRNHAKLREHQTVKVLTDQPLKLNRAA